MFTLHVFDLTFILGGEGDSGGVTAKKTARPVAAVQDCVPPFVSVTLPAMILAPKKKYIFDMKSGHFLLSS